MSLMNELMQERFGPPIKCSVHKVVQLMKGADRDDLVTAIEQNVIPATVISKVLDGRGIRLTAPAINSHRRHDCGCPR